MKEEKSLRVKVEMNLKIKQKLDFINRSKSSIKSVKQRENTNTIHIKNENGDIIPSKEEICKIIS